MLKEACQAVLCLAANGYELKEDRALDSVESFAGGRRTEVASPYGVVLQNKKKICRQACRERRLFGKQEIA